MGKTLVRQFKPHKAPAGARGYQAKRSIRKLGPADNPTQGGSVYAGKADDPGRKEHGESAGGRLKIDPTVGGGGDNYTLGQLLYQQQQAIANQPPPLPQPSANIPLAVDPRDFGYVPPQQPQPLPYTATLPPTALPPQRPIAPPVYTQPNVPIDITPEQFTLPPQPQPQQIIHERPTTIDYGPITTPIARPTEDLDYMWNASDIEPQQSYPITPGPQITATEQSFYEPQPVESAYAYPIQADYPQTQPQPLPPDLNQDEITNLIDTLIPEPQEAKTINFPQEGPQWVEDPYALAAQEAIDQAGFTQTDPSIVNLGMPPIIDEAPEITYTQPQQQDPYVIDYGPTYGEPAVQETAQAPYLPPEQPVQQLPITQPPELGMPEIPQQQDLVGGVRAEDDFFREDYHRDTDLKVGRGNIDEYVGGPIERDPVGAAAIVDESTSQVVPAEESVIPAKTITPEGIIIDDSDETYTVDTSAGVDIEQLPETPFAGEVAEGPLIDATEATVEGPVAEPDPEPFTPEIADPPAPTEGVDITAQVDPPVTTTPGQGGRKWVHTGPADFADALHQFRINRGTTQGPPIVTDTPAVSGPVVNRETGEITEKPLTWYQFEPSGSSVSPYTEGISTGTETGAKGPPDVTGVSATSGTGRGGEGRTPFQTFLENQDNAGELIPGGLNLDMASLKGQAGINQLRSEMTAKDFEGIDSFEGLGNFFNLKPAFQGFGESIASAIQELTGMEAGDLKGPGLWDTLNTPIPAFSTGEFGITPLDIITVIASGTVAIGPILMRKFMDSLMQPFEAAVTDGLKGVFNTVFKRGGDAENYNKQPVSQENINTADLEVLAEELGIDKPSGMIEAGTYYGADGTVIARNMKPLDFGLNTVDGANSFKDVLHAVGTKVDPGYTKLYYDTKTGQVDVVHADGTVTESASHITIDSEGNMQQGTGNSKKTKKVNWGVKVIGVNAIDTVAPRKDKGKGKGKGKGGSIWDWIKDKLPGKDDDEDDTTKKESGN